MNKAQYFQQSTMWQYCKIEQFKFLSNFKFVYTCIDSRIYRILAATFLDWKFQKLKTPDSTWSEQFPPQISYISLNL